MEKTIVPGCFATFPEGYTRILLQRHVAHTANMIGPLAIAHCGIIGHALAQTGIIIDRAYCSPANRAHLTSIYTQVGYGTMLYTKTKDGLSDMELKDGETLTDILAIMEGNGLKGGSGMATIAYNYGFLPIMQKRGKEGVETLKKITTSNKGKNILVTSHGVVRIEPTIQVLKGEAVHMPGRLVEEGQIIELIFNGDGDLFKENWLEAIPAPAAPKLPT